MLLQGKRQRIDYDVDIQLLGLDTTPADDTDDDEEDEGQLEDDPYSGQQHNATSFNAAAVTYGSIAQEDSVRSQRDCFRC